MAKMVEPDNDNLDLEEDCEACNGTGQCQDCRGDDDSCDTCEGTGDCLECDGSGTES